MGHEIVRQYLQQTGYDMSLSVRNLSPEEKYDLQKRAFEGDQEAINRLFDMLIKLVIAAVSKVQAQYPMKEQDYEDELQEGMMQMLDAIKTTDPDKCLEGGYTIENVVWYRVSNGLVMHYRRGKRVRDHEGLMSDLETEQDCNGERSDWLDTHCNYDKDANDNDPLNEVSRTMTKEAIDKDFEEMMNCLSNEDRNRIYKHYFLGEPDYNLPALDLLRNALALGKKDKVKKKRT